MRLVALAAALLTTVSAAAADLKTPPKSAKEWNIVSAGGSHGAEQAWTDKNGVRWSRMKILMRGLVYDVDQEITLGDDKRPGRLVVRGVTPSGDAGESFTVENGVARWKSPVDAGEAPWRDNLVYASHGGSLQASVAFFEALLADEDRTVDVLPSGKARISELTRLEAEVAGKRETLICYAVDGLSFGSSTLWFRENGAFFGSAGGLSFLPKGTEGLREILIKAEADALSARSPKMRADLLKHPGAPVLVRNATIYDAATNSFLKDHSVLIEGDRIVKVGKTKKVKAPKGAAVIDATGKTLTPGLFDMHLHTGDDVSTVLDLSMGMTSGRDIGNDKAQFEPRWARIKEGALLGPTLYPILGMDGEGPLAAQGFVRIKSVAEGEEALRQAKEEGYLGVKLYGTINPEWVAPLAAEAHRLSMSVQGHVPAGMRPSEAVKAGYDGVNHINFVVMEGMPDDVVATSNGLNRFFGPGQYAKDLDLNAEPMKSFIDLLAEKKTVVDPTLTVYEWIFTAAPGKLSSAAAPYAEALPAGVVRSMREGGLQPPEGFAATREDMKASFEKLKELVGVLHKRGVPIVAGTDGYPMDLIRELELYVASGLSIGDALETATDGAARALGVGEKVGSIAPGQAADLLLIDGDVAADIGALRQLDTIILGGKLIDADDARAAVGVSARPKRGDAH
jgi:hypothetical protein